MLILILMNICPRNLKHNPSEKWIFSILLLLILCSTVIANEFFQTTLTDWLYIYDSDIRFIDDFTYSNSFGMTYQFDNIYQKSISETPVSSAYGNQFMVSSNMKAINHQYDAGAAAVSSKFNNLTDNVDVKTQLEILERKFYIRSIKQTQNNYLDLFVNLKQNSSNIKTEILEFPHSDDRQFNKYFFDLLEPAFGKNQNVSWDYFKWDIRQTYLRYFKNTIWFGFNMQYQFSKPDYIIKYENNSNISSLTGYRKISLENRYSNFRASGILYFKDSFFNKIEFGYRRLYLSMYIDNNCTEIAGFSSLGSGNLQIPGYFINSTLFIKSLSINYGIIYSRFNADISVNTPVLGRETFLIFPMPVSHKATGKLKNGTQLSYNLKLLAPFTINKMENILSAEILYSRNQFTLIGNADLEFGLISKDLDYPIDLGIGMIKFNAQTSRILKERFRLCYQIQQFIPVYKRYDDSPVEISGGDKQKNIKYDGGRSHSLRLDLIF